LPSDPPVFDVGLLSPVTVGADATVSDAAVLAALVDVEVALTRAWGAVGSVPADVVDAVAAAIADVPVDAADLARRAVSGGNPVIPLVGDLRAAVAPADRGWVHRGATSQDIVDTALALVARRAGEQIDLDLRATARSLAALARAHRDVPAAARTLTQHAVPTTLGARFASWLRGVRAARADLAATLAALPAQLGGAGGTLASAVVLSDLATARELPAAFAAQLALAAPAAPWHVERRPVTRLGDALVAVTDALGVIAADVATASRTEIGELSEGVGGGSSAMPQKRNPAASVLVRSAALRAPQLAATLHLAAAGAVDERPDGAWHAEWPALRELLRVALGAARTAAALTAGLVVDLDAVARTLALSDGLIVAERLSAELAPLIGADTVAAAIAGATTGGDLRTLLEAPLAARGLRVDLDDLLDPARYLGLAAAFVDETLAEEDA
jgi:3-carboxy-cis,cis-muconate cycloisomerase